MNNIGNPDLILQLNEMTSRCDELIEELGRQGDLLAQAQYAYYRQKNATAYALKDAGVPVTLIQQIIKGEPPVAILMRERDIAKSRYEATKEAINIVKLQIRTVNEQVSREWNNG